jgi:hypothetical protein
MQTEAAILWELNTPWSVETIEFEPPKDARGVGPPEGLGSMPLRVLKQGRPATCAYVGSSGLELDRSLRTVDLGKSCVFDQRRRHVRDDNLSKPQVVSIDEFGCLHVAATMPSTALRIDGDSHDGQYSTPNNAPGEQEVSRSQAFATASRLPRCVGRIDTSVGPNVNQRGAMADLSRWAYSVLIAAVILVGSPASLICT